ncbi:hypothetical protein G9C85_05225 [Halorubellus sp. JP-L1]|uniref:DNA replication complex subunit Gins51 n=1 Tax=Halorubellus sp. JP-L1 TaxID=2715753 RepID=UPI00140B4976|nr:hypothetical protein [Halorubellus sp. JP-L1]NHN41038.1 hypothetical protein [Halorubellus sp. JP-L1]
MNIDELRSAQSKERQKSDLQQLRESFYGDVAEYVEELEAERERAADAAEDPFGSPEVQQLTNDIETAKDTAEAIYERRLGKIVKKASLVSAEMANPNDVNGLTAEEQALFSDLVARIEENKAHMLDVIAGDATPGAPADAGDVGAPDATSAAASADADLHPEAGLDADPAADASSDAGADEDPNAGESATDDDLRRSEAAAVAGVDDPDEDTTEDTTEGADESATDGVSAADLMGGDTDADAADTATGREGDDAATDATSEGAVDDDAGDAAADAAGEAGASTSAGDAADASDAGERATLRVTEDVGEIFGVDEREYRLSAEDVVTLPEENADVLVAQDAAERLD